MVRFFCILLACAASCAAQDDKPQATPAPAPTIPALLQTGQTGYMHGDYEAARKSYSQAWDLAQQLPPEDPVRYDVLKRLSSVRAAVGEFADADNYLQLAISWREQNLGQSDPKTVDDVLLSVAYARGMKDYERALLIMNRALGMHVRAAGTSESIPVADDFSRMAQIYMELKKPEQAVGMLNLALSTRTKLLGPLEPSLVYDLDRLGGIEIMQRSYDKAEETYRHALVIRETLYGKVHADLIATVDGLAYALFGQKKYDEAEPIYQRLLALWITSVGSEHPMVAAALDKIAIFYSQQNKWDQVREALSKANGIRTYLLVDGLSLEASQRIDEGKLDEALTIYHRAQQILAEPSLVSGKQRTEIDNVAKELEKVIKQPPTKAPARAGK